MTIKAYAKVNLTLEVYGIRADGYHELRSIVMPIALADKLEIEEAEGIVCESGFADDLCAKAARALDPEGSRGARIRVEKRIPVGGGLGGGSADAAATLIALNEMWDLGKTREELSNIGAAVGSDVPALVLAQSGVPVLMEGRGERVSALERMERRDIVLVNPGVHSSTAEVYAKCAARRDRPQGRVNDLQAAAIALHPEIGTALDALAAAGGREAMMSGSGSTVFAFADSPEQALEIAARVKKENGFDAWATENLVSYQKTVP